MGSDSIDHRLTSYVLTKAEKCRARLVELKGKVWSELGPNHNTGRSLFDMLAIALVTMDAAFEEYSNKVTAFTEKAKQYVANLPKSACFDSPISRMRTGNQAALCSEVGSLGICFCSLPCSIISVLCIITETMEQSRYDF